MGKWLCSQFGARENYAIPRALLREGLLEALYTDLWINPSGSFAFFDRGRRRFNSDLTKANIHHFNSRFLTSKFIQKIKPGSDDGLVYDQLVANELSKKKRVADNFFGYSYSSRLSMKSAKAAGYRTVVGQINPGPAEADIVREEFAKFHNGQFAPTVPDQKYWDLWREEIEYSDVVMVNSDWSSKLLQQAGVASSKIKVVPLAYEIQREFPSREFNRSYHSKNPLRILYLGGVGIRKGFHILVDAMRSIEHLPVTLDVVGELKGPKALVENLPSNTKYHGSVNKAGTELHYSNADVFILPTLSDGFGLTQLEAQLRKLPLIVSTHCAHVIDHMQNGIILTEVTSKTIIDAIQILIDKPELLPSFSAKSVSMEKYSLQTLAHHLANIG